MSGYCKGCGNIICTCNEKENTCKWFYHSNVDYFETECGRNYVYSECDITPMNYLKENQFNFCPYCGKKIEEAEQ